MPVGSPLLVALDAAGLAVGHLELRVDAAHRQRQRVQRRVRPGAKGDRMAGRRLVELGAGRIALLAQARDEDLRQRDPVPGLGRLGARAEVREHVLDGLHVRDGLLELVHRRARRMHVGIDQARQHRLAAEIDLLGARAGQLHDLGVRAGREDAPVANRHGLHDAKLRVDGHDLAVVEDVARRGLALAASCDNERQKDVDQVAVHRRSPESFKAASCAPFWLRIRSRR